MTRGTGGLPVSDRRTLFDQMATLEYRMVNLRRAAKIAETTFRFYLYDVADSSPVAVHLDALDASEREPIKLAIEAEIVKTEREMKAAARQYMESI